jgi:hypothetical protein
MTGLVGVKAMDVIPFPPVPFKDSCCGLPPPSSVMVSMALYAVPTVVGVKVTAITQLALGATWAGQAFD